MAHGRPDFSPTAVDVVLRPEWAAVEGINKSLVGNTTNKTFGQSLTVSYAIPSGKILYLTFFSFGIGANLAADADSNQFGYFQMLDNVTGLIRLHANGGFASSLPTPPKIVAGHTVYFTLTCYANHAVDLRLSVDGYEVNA